MDDFMYILPILIIATMILFIAFKLKGIKNDINANKMVVDDTNYCGVKVNVIIKYCGSSKLDVIKCIKETIEMSLVDAKNVVEGKGIIEAIPIERAELLVQKLNNIGASAEFY